MELIFTILKTIYDFTLGLYFNGIKNAFLEQQWLTLFLLLLPEILFILFFFFAPTPEEERKMENESFERKVAATLYPTKPKFHQVFLPLPNGESIVADLVSVNTKGVFCFKCIKCEKDRIMFGAISDQTWMLKDLNGRTVGELINPLEINLEAIKALQKYLSVDGVFSVVVTNTWFDIMWQGKRYDDFCNNILNEGAALLNTSGLYDFEDAVENLPDILTKEEVERICVALKSCET